MKVSRRQFILGAAGMTALYPLLKKPAPIPGDIVGASHRVGHRLREGSIAAPDSESRVPIVIVGGGIAGLSAAWRLKKRGFHDFVLLELEPDVGGNSRSGENRVSPYPWGAHYVPPPGPDATLVTELFEDLGVIKGRAPDGRPIYDEFYLCASPQERLYLHGRWQEGLLPLLGASAEEAEQIHDFQSAMERFKHAAGSDGKRAFSIPVESSSRDPKFTDLDRISMAQLMKDRGWSTRRLRWYVDYCCRDDYGARMKDVSAWAGIHYFASRAFQAANVEDYTILTWPEGNGWLVKKLREFFPQHIRTGSLVTNIRPGRKETSVDVFSPATAESSRYLAAAVVYAAPRFTAPHVLSPFKEHRPDYLASLEYGPWMVANLTLRQLPYDEHSQLAWDNVFFDSPSLGYINATHQSLKQVSRETVLTYYLPLSHKPPRAAREEAIARTHAEWTDIILRELQKPHPGIREDIARIDVQLWGHGMIRPSPGFIWGDARRAMKESLGSVYFAHSDMSGISIFEEAQFWGARAADQALSRIESASHG